MSAHDAVKATPPDAALDNALYLPRLDRMSLAESALVGAGPDYSEMLESICGVADDSQPVEQYDGTLASIFRTGVR